VNDCYLCGQEGHVRSECPSRVPVPAAVARAEPATGIIHPPVPVWQEGEPPSAEYLQARAGLGHTPGGEYLLVACPWCESGAFQPCVNRATGGTRNVHDARKLKAAEFADLRG
jgi:Zinc knuckle